MEIRAVFIIYQWVPSLRCFKQRSFVDFELCKIRPGSLGVLKCRFPEIEVATIIIHFDRWDFPSIEPSIWYPHDELESSKSWNVVAAPAGSFFGTSTLVISRVGYTERWLLMRESDGFCPKIICQRYLQKYARNQTTRVKSPQEITKCPVILPSFWINHKNPPAECSSCGAIHPFWSLQWCHSKVVTI